MSQHVLLRVWSTKTVLERFQCVKLLRLCRLLESPNLALVVRKQWCIHRSPKNGRGEIWYTTVVSSHLLCQYRLSSVILFFHGVPAASDNGFNTVYNRKPWGLPMMLAKGLASAASADCAKIGT